MLLNIFLIRSANFLAVSLRKLFEGYFPEKNMFCIDNLSSDLVWKDLLFENCITMELHE